MTRDNFLTTRWNNLLSLALGVPTIAFIIAGFATALWTEPGGLIGLGILGAFF